MKKRMFCLTIICMSTVTAHEKYDHITTRYSSSTIKKDCINTECAEFKRSSEQYKACKKECKKRSRQVPRCIFAYKKCRKEQDYTTCLEHLEEH